MKYIFIFYFDGSWLGGKIIIVANGVERALKEARQHLIANGYGNDVLRLEETYKINTTEVIYYDNGDY